MSLFRRKLKSGPVPTVAPIPKKNAYDFIAKCYNEESRKALEKYQKFWTDPEDKYEGMALKEFKEDGSPGDKIYQYPPLDVDVKLDAFISIENDNVSINVFVLDNDKEILVGTAAKTKAKKILKILQEENPKITGELYGGKYWKMEDSGYVNNDWSEELTVRVFLEW